jgi:glycosyltransferase involved in cell wall biosynthesis
MAKPIVLSSMAAEGIGKPVSSDYQVEDSPEAMAQLICDLLVTETPESESSSKSNRAFVVEHFSWESEMHKFSDLLNGVSS